jgi:Cu(I)/Ag(I) efflux system membrane fusion protein
MILDVVLKCDLGMGLRVAEGAVVAFGSRTVAYVESPEDGDLVPREIRVGPPVGLGVQVLSGLAEGERVLSTATFLVDAEASLRGATALLSTTKGVR